MVHENGFDAVENSCSHCILTVGYRSDSSYYEFVSELSDLHPMTETVTAQTYDCTQSEFIDTHVEWDEKWLISTCRILETKTFATEIYNLGRGP